MTLIKKSNKRGTSYGGTGFGRHYVGAIPVLEDPRSTSNQIYLFDDAHDKSTLNPIFNTSVSVAGNGGSSSSYGYNYRGGNYEGTSGGSGYGHSIATAGGAVNICQNGNTGNDIQNNLDLTQFMSMDPDNPATPIKLWQNGDGKSITKFGGTAQSAEIDVTIFSNVGTTELSELSADYTNYGYENGSDVWRPMMPLHLDDNGIITGISARTEGNGYGSEQWYPVFSFFRLYTHPDPTTISVNGGLGRTDYNLQYIGASAISNQPIFMFNAQNTDYQQYIERFNTSANTKTTLHSFTTTPTGGARSQTAGLFAQIKLASTTFIDDDSDTAFYVPYFNVTNDYQPLYFKWNKTTDVFTRSECTMNGDSSGLYFGNLDGIAGNRDGWSAAILNETFTYGTGRYVSIIPMNSAYQANDGTASARTIVTYAVDSAENSTLTHHSTVTIPSTIKNILFLNDQKTRMAVALQDAVEFYNFTGTGWSKTGNFAGEVHGIGRTIDGKIYMAVDDQADNHVSVHQISNDIPLTISVLADSDVYTYTGTEINTNLTVNALDYNNDRIEANITLEIDGSTIVFADSSSTKAITTSASADTTVPIRIVGAGFSNVITKLQV